MSRLHKLKSFGLVGRHSKLYCLCSRDIQNFIVCAVATFKTLLFVQSRHSKLYCLCSRDIQNFIVCAVATFKTLLFVQSRHSKLYCLCSGDIQNFIVCAIATFKTILFVQSSHSKLFSLRVPSGAPYRSYFRHNFISSASFKTTKFLPRWICSGTILRVFSACRSGVALTATMCLYNVSGGDELIKRKKAKKHQYPTFPDQYLPTPLERSETL